MNDIMAVFSMHEINPKIRARMIIKLGTAINSQHGMNLTEAMVFELVTQLDPENEILTQDHYKNAK
jgi:hypothetical protein